MSAKTVIPTKLQTKICQDYLDGKAGLKVLKTRYGFGRPAIRRTLIEHGIPIRPSCVNTPYSLNSSFFSSINTEAKAYILGFIHADGTLSAVKSGNHYMVINVKESDKQIVNDIALAMEATVPIQLVKRRPSGYRGEDIARLCIGNKQIYSDLIALRVKEPQVLQSIPSTLIHHFIRGVFDGDGCISVNYGRVRKGEWTFYLLGIPELILKLDDILCMETGINKCKLVYPHPDLLRARHTGRGNVTKIGRYLYNDANIYLQRKYDLFIRTWSS